MWHQNEEMEPVLQLMRYTAHEQLQKGLNWIPVIRHSNDCVPIMWQISLEVTITIKNYVIDVIILLIMPYYVVS